MEILRNNWIRQEAALRPMLENSVVREVLVSHHGDKWGLAIHLGGAQLAHDLRRR